MLRLMLFAAVVLLAAPAHAASFKCAKASSKIEKAICADATLSGQDEAVAQAYAAAKQGVSSQAKQAVEEGQKSWLSYLKKICSDAALKPAAQNKAELAAARTNCLKESYASRLKELAKNRDQQGLRIYTLTRYKALAAAPSEGLASQIAFATSEQSLPQIDSLAEDAIFFNNAMKKYKKSDAKSDNASNTMLEVSLTAIRPSLFSVEENRYFYGHGAAHGMSNKSYKHLLRAEKRELKAKDIFKGTEWRKVLAQKTVESLKDVLGYDPDATELNKPDSYIFSPTRWNFTPEGLKVQFNEYEVASYAEGQPVATVPWAVLQPYLQPRAASLLEISATFATSPTVAGVNP